MQTLVIEKTIHDGQLYITTESRGTEYCLMRLGDAWFVGTRRLALGNAHKMGGGKHYATLADVAKGCKAFGTEADLVALVYGC